MVCRLLPQFAFPVYRQNDKSNRIKLRDEFCRTRAEIEECASMDGSICLAIGTHEGDAATGEANGRGAARKVMEPAWVREGMDEGNGLADPARPELADKLFRQIAASGPCNSAGS